MRGKLMKDKILNRFTECFDGKAPEFISRASGRVELLGGHTDYNDGFVIASAIDSSFWVACPRRDDSMIRMYSEWAGDYFEFDPSQKLKSGEEFKWANYGIGVAKLLAEAGVSLGGANLMITGNVPVGAGLSSSAALEISIAKALMSLFNGQHIIDNKALAQICQKAENVYAESPCGIMDQTVVAHGVKDHAIMLDCRSLNVEHLPLDSHNCCVMIFNSMVSHQVGGGDYGDRRQQCEKALEIIAPQEPEIKALRDVDEKMLSAFEDKLGELLYKRARHVVTENARVLAGKEALIKGDLVKFGRLMHESHCSARDLYQISCEQIDFLVEEIIKCNGAFGARLSGGGFGGAAVAVVDPGFAEEIKNKVAKAYKKQFGISSDIYVAKPFQGTEVVKV